MRHDPEAGGTEHPVACACGASSGEPQPAPFSEAQQREMCHRAAVDTEPLVRKVERETGKPAQRFDEEACVKSVVAADD